MRQAFLGDGAQCLGYGLTMNTKFKKSGPKATGKKSYQGKSSGKPKHDGGGYKGGGQKSGGYKGKSAQGRSSYGDKRKPMRAPEPIVPAGIPVIVTVIDADGDVFGLPEEHALVGEYPRLRLQFKGFSGPAPTVGDVVLVNDPTPDLTEDSITFSAVVVGRPQPEPEPVAFIGEYAMDGDFKYVRPMLKELSGVTFKVVKMNDFSPEVGDIVRAQAVPDKYGKGRARGQGSTAVEILEAMGPNPKNLASMVAIENFKIRTEWPEAVIAESDGLKKELSPEDLAAREDLRTLPIVTIDGADAKDFDDAVWAEKEGDGFHIIVAIADVAHYVRQGSELDKEAIQRGNSTYFPDMVVPMLPERLSNDLCSLRPHEDRPVLAVHMHIDGQGRLQKFKFSRAVIHSHARLTYERAQDALDGKGDEAAAAVLESTLLPLQAAYKVLWQARQRRHAIDLDIPESMLVLDDAGLVTEVGVRSRLDTHKLIEEMMILANVAAARALGTKGAPCLYRIHPEPDNKKLDTLKGILQPHGVSVKAASPTQQDYASIIDKVRGHPAETMLMKSILQSQMQAKYSTDNVGHYGLALSDYAHFTSPIRRYADLTVHRHLVESYELAGEGGVSVNERDLGRAAESINDTERRSQKAEWEARDRLMTRFYQDFVGEKFEATVVTLMQYGCFMSIGNGVAEGLLPMRLMKDDHYIYDEKQSFIIGKKTKRKLQVGSIVEVTLAQADRVEGRLTFSLGR